VTVHKKIRFTFENTEGQSETESLWVFERDAGYEIDNIPFYVKNVAVGDLVSAERDENGLLWFSKLIKSSGHSTIRIWFAREDDVATVREQLRRLGCSSEVSDIRRLVAVDIPPTVEYRGIKMMLDDGEAAGNFDYEEACLGLL
jgi:hypothetical protein